MLLGISGCGSSKDFDLKIDGPKEVLAGDLTVFKAVTSNDDVTFVWKILPPSGEKNAIVTGTDGNQYAFSSRTKGIYHIVLVGLNSGCCFTDSHIEVVTHEFVNGDSVTPPAPPTPPNPNPPGPVPPTPPIPPNPGPVPPLPEPSLNELRDYVTTLAMAKVPDSAKRVEVANKLADSMLSIASAIQAGAYDSLELRDIRVETRKLNQEAIGWDNSIDWFNFSTELSKKIEELEKSNKLKERKDYAQAWQAIGEGLKAVKSEVPKMEPVPPPAMTNIIE